MNMSCLMTGQQERVRRSRLSKTPWDISPQGHKPQASARSAGLFAFSAALRLHQKPGRSPLLGGGAGGCRSSTPDLPHGAGGVRAGGNGSAACRRWRGQSHLLLAQSWDESGRVKKYRGAYQVGAYHRQEDPHLAGILRRCH